MGIIKEALQQLNEIDTTTNNMVDNIKNLKYKLHLPNMEYEDELDDSDNPIINPETGRAKQVRIPSSYIYILTRYNPETDAPFKHLCKIGYAKDVNIRLGQFNNTAGDADDIDWFAKIPIYQGEYDEETGEFKPLKGTTDQLDKKIHNVIDSVVTTADNYMKRRYQTQQGIDMRRTNVNGHNKEWYKMEPQEAVDIIETIIETQPINLYGDTEYNINNPLYTKTHQTVTYSDQGNKIVRTKTNTGEKGNRIDLLQFAQPGDILTFDDGDRKHIDAINISPIKINEDGRLEWNGMIFRSPTGLRNYLIKEITKDSNHHGVKAYDSFFYNGKPLRDYMTKK